jgi:hypothetical protein
VIRLFPTALLQGKMPAMSDPFKLQRFVDAQSGVIDRVYSELRGPAPPQKPRDTPRVPDRSTKPKWLN